MSPELNVSSMNLYYSGMTLYYLLTYALWSLDYGFTKVDQLSIVIVRRRLLISLGLNVFDVFLDKHLVLVERFLLLLNGGFGRL